MAVALSMMTATAAGGLMGCAAASAEENVDSIGSATSTGGLDAFRSGEAIAELTRELSGLETVGQTLDAEIAQLDAELLALDHIPSRELGLDAMPAFASGAMEVAYYADEKDKEAPPKSPAKPAPPAEDPAVTAKRAEIQKRRAELLAKKKVIDDAITDTQAIKELMKGPGNGEAHPVTIIDAYLRRTLENSKLLPARTGLSETLALENKRLHELADQVEKVNKNLANKLRAQLTVSLPTSAAVKAIEKEIQEELAKRK